MSDYIGITEAQSNPFAPLTSELVKQLRDNPLAIAEGATGAPRIQGIGLATFIGRSAASGFTTFTDLDSNAIVFVLGRNVALSNDNGSTFSSSLGSVGTFIINLHTGDYNALQVSSTGGTISGAPFNALRADLAPVLFYVSRGDGL